MASRIAAQIVAVLRLGFAALAGYTLGFACNRASTPPTGVGTVNFFSYFTILSNISATVTFAVGGIALLLGRRGLPDGMRGAVTCYMTVTGIIYAVVLRPDAEQAGQLAQWIDDVVHLVMPIAVFVDWLVVPPREKLRYSIVRYWLLFPVAFVTYSLIRGHFVNWYPYPFLDPRGRGYAHVAVECCLIALVIVGVCLAVVWLARLLRAKVSSDVML
jgi:hypothetical protein